MPATFSTSPSIPIRRMLMASVPRLRSELEPEFITGQPPSLARTAGWLPFCSALSLAL